MPLRRRPSLDSGRAPRALRARLVAAEHAIKIHRRVIAALHRIAALALHEQPLPAVLQEAAQEVSVATGFPIVAIEFYDPLGQCMEVAAVTGIPLPEGQVSLRVCVDQTLSGLVAQSGQLLIETHAQDRPEYAHPVLRQLGVQTFICLPLTVADQVIGTLALAHPLAVPLDADLVPLAQSLTHAIATLVAHRRAEAELQVALTKYRTLFDSFPLGIAVADIQGQIIEANGMAERLLGLGQEAQRQRAIDGVEWRIVRPDGSAMPAAEYPGVRALQEQRVIEDVEMGVMRSNGETIWLNVTAAPIPLAGYGVVMTAIDITARKRAELELRELNGELEQRVSERTAALQASQERLTLATRSAGIGIWDFDVITKTLIWDERMYELYGIAPDTFGSTYEALKNSLHPDDHAEAVRVYQRAQRGEQEYDTEFRVRRPDGAVRVLKAYANVQRDPDGAAVRMIGVNWDITARKQAEAALRESEVRYRTLVDQLRLSEARLQLLLAKTPAVIFSALAEPDYRTTFISESVRAVLGYEPAQFMDHPGFWGSRIHPEDQVRVFSDAPQFRQQGWRMYEYRYRHADSSYRWIENGVSLLAGVVGHPAEVIGYMIDITERKQAEALLRRANAELARAARDKDAFLANMSHELRTPLNAILGFSEILLEQVRGPLNERQQESLRHIESSGHHLLVLINDILDLAKVEAGRLDLQPERVDIVEVCEASLLFVKELALKKALHIDLQLSDPQAEMQADPRRLKQMLVNLLSNAVKFTPSGGRITLDVAVHAAAGLVYFAVQDTGIGIAPEDLRRLFQPFSQVDSALSRKHEGTGLGLALVHRLAELHGGRVHVESTLGVGSRFTIILPYHGPQQSQPATPTALGGSCHSLALVRAPAPAQSLLVPQVLLAEDDDANSAVICEYLQTKGYQVVIAHTGQEALDQIGVVRPTIILMDIQMPGMDGLETIRCLRARPDNAAMPIIALTALAMRGDRERCLGAGATAYMTKPVSLERLVDLIEQLIHA